MQWCSRTDYNKNFFWSKDKGWGLDTNGNVVIQEYKSSLTAPLTNNQARAFQEIFENGGVVVGNGKGIFTRGYQIPAGTEVKIVRPN